MKLVANEDITETTLNSSDVPLTDYDEWDPTHNSGSGYDLGDTVRRNLVAYESLTGSNTDDPEDGVDKDPKTWTRLGYINRWRMFTEGRDSVTSQLDAINVEVQPEKLVTTVMLFNCRGATARVIMTDSVDGVVYDETKELIEYGVTNWWRWYFEPYDSREDVVFQGLPPYIGATIDIIIEGNSASDTVQCGRVAMGPEYDLGVTEYGTNVSRIDSSTRERDGFGNLRIVKRRTIRVVDYRVTLDTNNFDYVERKLRQYASEPAGWIGSTRFEATLLFGTYEDFRLDLSTRSLSDATIEAQEY